MSTASTPEDRARVSAINRSIRNIKNELENLSEHNVLTDEQYDLLMSNMPVEVTLRSLRNLPGAAPSTVSSPAPPVDALAGLSVNDSRSGTPGMAAPPPAYNASASPPPPQPAPVNARPEIAHAVALYRYVDADPRDLDLEPQDHVSVLAYVNPEWWEGINVRTGATGIFPMNYVRVESGPSPLAALATGPPAHAEKAPVAAAASGYYGSVPPQQQAYYPPPSPMPMPMPYNAPPPQQNPYNSNVPPMAVANQDPQAPDRGQSQVGEMGKKFGKKLGNAAIFGAGATIGADIVNSIF